MQISRATAQSIAQSAIDARQDAQVVPIALGYVHEYPSAYVFTYNSRTYLETGAIEHALAGSGGPIIVRKQDGALVGVAADVDIEGLLGEAPITEWMRVQDGEPDSPSG